MTVFDQTMFRAVPRLYRATEATLIGDASGSVPTPVPAFVRFGSWVGGDRDGNPYVTAEVTRQAVATYAEHALRWLNEAVLRVGRTMTLDAARHTGLTGAAGVPGNRLGCRPGRLRRPPGQLPREPHRQKMLVIAARIGSTLDGRLEASYRAPEDLLADLRMVQRSLEEARAHRAAHGELQHLIWSVQTFGFHLVELEIRQHSQVHRAALLDLIAQLPGVTDPAAHVDDVGFLDALAVDGWPAFVEAAGGLAPRRSWTPFASWPGCSNAGETGAADRSSCRSRRPRLTWWPCAPWHGWPWATPRCGWTWSPSSRPEPTSRPRSRRWTRGSSCAAPGSGWPPGERAVEVMLGYSDSAKDVGPASATLNLARTQGDARRLARGVTTCS